MLAWNSPRFLLFIALIDPYSFLIALIISIIDLILSYLTLRWTSATPTIVACLVLSYNMWHNSIANSFLNIVAT